MLTNNFTVDTVLSPQAQRNTGTPDIGYEYDPLDYVVNGMTLTNTLTLTNGVALGAYGSSSSYGISISGTGKLISGGSPTSLNHIVRYSTVQEQSTTNWSSSTVGPSVKIASANASAGTCTSAGCPSAARDVHSGQAVREVCGPAHDGA